MMRYDMIYLTAIWWQ